MTLWPQLQACTTQPAPAGFPDDTIVLFAPRDNIPHALQLLIGSATASVKVEMFTYCDQTLHPTLKAKAATVEFQATFDESEYQRVRLMRQLVDDLAAAAHVAVGESEHHRIIHRKVVVVDHLYVAGGSTNWTDPGERLEDNELVIRRSPPLAGWYEQVLDANFARVKARMAAKAA